MTATQYSVISSVKKAKKPEDLFGLVSTDVSKQKETLEKIKQVFWKMSKVIHPDIYKAKDASELFDKLNRLRNEAEKKCTGEKDPLYNSNGVLVKPVEFKSRHFTYSLFRRIANGGTCGIFEGVAKDRLNNTVNVIARAAKSSKDSDLMEREAKAFEIFNRKLKDISQWEDGKKAAERFSWKIPYFVESVKLKEPHSDKLKVVNIFSRLEEYKTGWYSLEDIHERYPQGVDMRIAAFIFNRVLEALTLSHSCGVVHGAITPNHVLVHAETHVGNLIDWTSSCHNEMIIPGNGGGNSGEAYHLPIYAAANHTKLECFEQNGQKGFFFLICDEEPYYYAGDPSVHGTSPAIAKEVFGDTLEKEVSMLDSLKKLAERYHVFCLRPEHTSHGRDNEIKKLWQKLFRDAGEDPERVINVGETEALISTMAMTIGRLAGIDRSQLVDVLKAKGAAGVDSADIATLAIRPGEALVSVGATSSSLVEGEDTGRDRS